MKAVNRTKRNIFNTTKEEFNGNPITYSDRDGLAGTKKRLRRSGNRISPWDQTLTYQFQGWHLHLRWEWRLRTVEWVRVPRLAGQWYHFDRLHRTELDAIDRLEDPTRGGVEEREWTLNNKQRKKQEWGVKRSEELEWNHKIGKKLVCEIGNQIRSQWMLSDWRK